MNRLAVSTDGADGTDDHFPPTSGKRSAGAVVIWITRVRIAAEWRTFIRDNSLPQTLLAGLTDITGDDWPLTGLCCMEATGCVTDFWHHRLRDADELGLSKFAHAVERFNGYFNLSHTTSVIA